MAVRLLDRVTFLIHQRMALALCAAAMHEQVHAVAVIYHDP